jgi:hypothetical protein
MEMTSLEIYKDTMKLFSGKLVVLKIETTAGAIQLEVNGAGLKR